MTTGLFLVRLTGYNFSFSFNVLNQKRPHYCTLTATTPEENKLLNSSKTLPFFTSYPHRVSSLSMVPQHSL